MNNLIAGIFVVVLIAGGVLVIHVIGLGILHLMDRQWAKKPGRWL